jgi:hypothetical protein
MGVGYCEFDILAQARLIPIRASQQVTNYQRTNLVPDSEKSMAQATRVLMPRHYGWAVRPSGCQNYAMDVQRNDNEEDAGEICGLALWRNQSARG